MTHTLLAAGSPSCKGVGRWRLLHSSGKIECTTEQVKKSVDEVYPDADFKFLERHEGSLIFTVRKGFDRAQRERFLEKLEEEQRAKR